MDDDPRANDSGSVAARRRRRGRCWPHPTMPSTRPQSGSPQAERVCSVLQRTLPDTLHFVAPLPEGTVTLVLTEVADSAALTNVLTAVVLAFIFSRLVTGVRLLRRPDVRAHWGLIVRGLRLRHFLLAPLALVLVIVAAGLLLQVPGLDFGWWTAIGGIGNPVTGATDATTGTALEWLIPAVFVLLLIPALPLFAEREEQMFRAGAEHWSWPRRMRRAVEFGAVHALVGIPIGAALALSIGGIYFTWRYLNGGILESTRAHLAYNLEVILIIAIVLATGAAA